MPNIDLFSTYTLRAVVEEIRPETFFFRDRYFKTEEGDIFKSDKVLCEYRKGSRKMAAFVSPRIGALTSERGGYSVYEYEPAYIGISRGLSGDDLKKRGFGEALFSDSTPAERAIKLQLKDMTELDLSISRREEWISVQTMINNACTMQEINEDGTKGEIRYVQFFENTSEHTYITANKWNSSTADIIGDIKAMCDLLAKRGMNAADLVIGSDVADAFENNEKIRELLNRNTMIKFGEINEKIEYPGVSSLGTLNFRGYLLKVWVVSNTYEDDNGNDVPYFPADAAMVTFPGCGHMMYGQITQIPYGKIDFETIAAKRVPNFSVEKNTRSLILATRPLAAPKTYCPYIFSGKIVG